MFRCRHSFELVFYACADSAACFHVAHVCILTDCEPFVSLEVNATCVIWNRHSNCNGFSCAYCDKYADCIAFFRISGGFSCAYRNKHADCIASFRISGGFSCAYWNKHADCIATFRISGGFSCACCYSHALSVVIVD